jgi:polar amino acid transport system substrate-binding protein
MMRIRWPRPRTNETHALSNSAFRLIIGLVLLFGVVLPANAQEEETLRLRQRLKSGVLRWGGDAEGGAPYQLRDPKDPDRVIGYEVELADALAEVLARRIGATLKAEFIQYQFDTLDAGLLESKDFDVIICGKEIVPENTEKMRFSRPYYIYKQQLVVRRDESRIESIRDCGDKSVGTLSGSASQRLLEQYRVGRIEGYDDQVAPYLDLELGRLDAVLLDTPITLYYASTNPKLRYAGKPIGKGEYGVAFRPDDEELTRATDVAIGELITSGLLRQIYRRWHLWNPDQAALARAPQREAELKGLGFDASGQPLVADEPPPPDAVDIDLIRASARSFTLDVYLPLLVRAAVMTVFLSACSMALAVALGLLVAVGRLYGPAPVRWLSLAYVEFFRGIPLLLLLFFLYFGLAAYGLAMPALVAGIIGFGINYAAFEAEIYRTAILAVPRGQWEAGRALGMSDGLTFRRIIFPQAIRTALPPMTNDFVALFKDTSLISVIAVTELTKEYLILAKSSLKFAEIGLATAVLYLLMSVPLGYLSRYLEKRWGKGLLVG